MTNEPTNKETGPGELPSHLIHALKSIRLSSDTYTRMRADLSAYADLYEIQDAEPVSRRFTFSAFMLQTRTVYAGALALVVIITGGTQVTSAAENAVPGDILYPIKVSLAEPLALALSGSERKAEFAAEFASRRVDEAAVLSEKGTLDEKTADTLAVNFSKHVDTVTQETGALEAKGDVAFSLAIRTDLEQKIASRMEGLAPEALPLAMSASDASDASDAENVSESTQTFAARISQKSKQLALTRESIETVIAVDTDSEAAAPINLAALREVAKPEVAMTRLFTAKLSDEELISDVASTGTTTATSTATTTEPAVQNATEPATQRFFVPFLKR